MLPGSGYHVISLMNTPLTGLLSSMDVKSLSDLDRKVRSYWMKFTRNGSCDKRLKIPFDLVSIIPNLAQENKPTKYGRMFQDFLDVDYTEYYLNLKRLPIKDIQDVQTAWIVWECKVRVHYHERLRCRVLSPQYQMFKQQSDALDYFSSKLLERPVPRKKKTRETFVSNVVRDRIFMYPENEDFVSSPEHEYEEFEEKDYMIVVVGPALSYMNL